MTDEEKKAIETIKNFIKYYKKNEQTGNRASLDVLREEIEAIQIALNLIQKQDTEINKLNKIIDKMAERIEEETYWVFNDLEYASKEEIKEYFIKEVESEETKDE